MRRVLHVAIECYYARINFRQGLKSIAESLARRHFSPADRVRRLRWCTGCRRWTRVLFARQIGRPAISLSRQRLLQKSDHAVRFIFWQRLSVPTILVLIAVHALALKRLGKNDGWFALCSFRFCKRLEQC